MRSLQVAFAVLECVAENQPVGVSLISRELELPKTTVQRSLEALAREGWILRSDNRDWILSSKVLGLAAHMDVQKHLSRVAKPAMKKLTEAVQETVHLTVLEGSVVVLIEKSSPARALRTWSRIGGTQPAYTASTGKAMLAPLSDEEIRQIVGTELAALTPRTVTSFDNFMKKIKETRRKGYAINDREGNPDITAIAAAIVDRLGRPVAAISISAPSSRVPRSKWAEYGALVIGAANSVVV
ncbi:IclR family transcriptional regulator [Antricoccus suffuscus]|uniref:IclR family transcriptional regulator n=1 Tax=Antricoccus suffuscus TaxID=1629062 RepID=UPI001472EBBB|nr:IclR family transcriptional regulator [Antricoccus suffuscus]